MFSDIYRNSTEKTGKYVKELSLSVLKRNIYYVEFNFLNIKFYVFKMFLPNFNRID